METTELSLEQFINNELQQEYNSIEGINKQINNLQEQSKLIIRILIEKSVKFILNKYDWIEYIWWPQYTPYWNDGDTCYFCVHEPGIKLKNNNDFVQQIKLLELLDLEHGLELSNYDIEESNHELIKNLKYDLNSLYDVTILNDEVTKLLYDDHVKVICSRENITTEEFNHE